MRLPLVAAFLLSVSVSASADPITLKFDLVGTDPLGEAFKGSLKFTMDPSVPPDTVIADPLGFAFDRAIWWFTMQSNTVDWSFSGDIPDAPKDATLFGVNDPSLWLTRFEDRGSVTLRATKTVVFEDFSREFYGFSLTGSLDASVMPLLSGPPGADWIVPMLSAAPLTFSASNAGALFTGSARLVKVTEPSTLLLAGCGVVLSLYRRRHQNSTRIGAFLQ